MENDDIKDGEGTTNEGAEGGEPKTDGSEGEVNTGKQKPVAKKPAKKQDEIETVEFKFNKNVNLGGVLIKAGEAVEVTVDEAEEFEKAGHGKAV